MTTSDLNQYKHLIPEIPGLPDLAKLNRLANHYFSSPPGDVEAILTQAVSAGSLNNWAQDKAIKHSFQNEGLKDHVDLKSLTEKFNRNPVANPILESVPDYYFASPYLHLDLVSLR